MSNLLPRESDDLGNLLTPDEFAHEAFDGDTFPQWLLMTMPADYMTQRQFWQLIMAEAAKRLEATTETQYGIEWLGSGWDVNVVGPNEQRDTHAQYPNQTKIVTRTVTYSPWKEMK